MSDPTSPLSPETRLEALIAAGADLADIESLLADYPQDPRLHFLHGSVLAGMRLYPEARAAIGRALTLAPEFDVARFQLGFLEFTSGEPERAAATWEPLKARAEDNPFRLFARGLMRLVGDDVTGAVALLRRGMAANDDNPPLNHDMETLITALQQAAPPEEPLSETQILLSQFGAAVRH